MGFKVEIRNVRNAQLPPARRYVALRSAVTFFSPNGFNQTFSNLAEAVGKTDAAAAWTEAQLTQAADLLVQSRELYQIRKNAWDAGRRKNKALGENRPTAPELEERDSASWFDAVSAGSQKPRFASLSLDEWAEKMMLDPEPFGSELAEDLQIVRNAMPPSELEPVGQIIAQHGPYPSLFEPANVVAVPYRIYADPIPEAIYDSFSPTQKAIADCLYSRSNDGYTRQRHLKRIVRLEELWVIPYVVLAIGDYVIEVVQEVETGLSELLQPYSWQESSYRLFADHNGGLIDLVRQRAISYLNCYYSNRFDLLEGLEGRPRYPALEILDAIGRPKYGELRYRTSPRFDTGLT